MDDKGGNMEKEYDKIMIGAGLYGLYAAVYCAERGQRVLVLEREKRPMERATYVNQARVHMGYHYPRSLFTAVKSAGYFARFVEDFSFCIHSDFRQIYATSAQFSWTDAEQFMTFCRAAGIRCDEVPVSEYFQPGMCDGAFLTEEYTYDAGLLRQYYEEKISASPHIRLLCDTRIQSIRRQGKEYVVRLSSGEEYHTGFILNATYASSNQVLQLVEEAERESWEPFPIKYELCEIILCRPSGKLKGIGITVMDGPFFSVMPFGKTGYHSLTSVTFTPHMTGYDTRPRFSCQEGADCSGGQLDNCNLCPYRPRSAWPYMDRLAGKYLREEYGYQYEKSLFSMKPILKSSEVDDSRPTMIRVDSNSPAFISVLSGKINTVYDLEEYLA